MSLHLHLFARSDELLASLRPQLGAARSASVRATAGIPRQVPVLVNSTQLSEWLQVRLARELGLSMGVEFLQPAAYFARHFGGRVELAAFSKSQAFWSPEQLRWHILPWVDSISTHLGHEPSRSLASRDRFAFAQLMADQFARYARYRPDWPDRWNKNECAWHDLSSPVSPDSRDDEAWQRQLWLTLLQSDGALPHPAQLLAELFQAEADAASAPDPLFVVGADLCDPLLLRTLQALAYRGQTVYLYLLLPSLGYLGDITRRSRWRSQFALPDQSDENEGGGHPLLASLGQKAVGAFLLLESISPDYAEWPNAADVTAVEPPSSSTLLHRLQSDVRQQRLPVGRPTDPGCGDARPVLLPDDDSLRIHCCHSPRRELEVLRDELLRAFAEIPDLQPEDVLIAVTDFDTYAPLAESILRVGPNALPVRLTAIPAREANAVAVALLALLRLSLGRLTASEMLELLNLAAIQHRLQLAGDQEALVQLGDAIRQMGVTHGLDAAQRGTADDTGTWRAALDRHVAGVWFGPVPEVRDAAAALVHPVAGDLPTNEPAILRFMGWLTDLATHLLAWSEPAPAAIWEERLQKAVSDLLHSETLDNDNAAVRRLLSELAAVTATENLDAAVMWDWLQPQLENATSLRTTIGGEILLGRLDQIHGLPCRVLAILGLQDGAFPRSSRRPAWDLLAHRGERWDADPRTDDRQLFLDSLLTPTERFILSAANRSLRTPHDGPLSSCVDELLRVVYATVRPPQGQDSVEAQIMVRHRIQPFAPEYFSSQQRVPRSFDANAARIAGDLARAQAGALHPFYVAPVVAPESLSEDLATLPLAQLIAFWKDPAKAWLRAMQLDLAADESDDTGLDDSPITLDALQRYEARRTALGVRLPAAGVDAKVAVARMAANRELPPGSLAALTWEQCDREIELLAAELAERLPQTHRTDICVALDSQLRVAGEVLFAEPAGRTPWILVYRPSKYDSPKYQIEAYIQTLVTTVQRNQPVECQVLGLGETCVNILSPIPVEIARVQLTTLVTGYFEGQSRPLCFAPAASEACAAKLDGKGDGSAGVSAAVRAWSKEPFHDQPGGEGTTAAARLAWRDADPFTLPLHEEWLKWATTISGPLKAWWKNVPQVSPAAAVTLATSHSV